MDYTGLQNQAIAQGKAAYSQGQSMLASDQSNASNYQNEYNDTSNQATAANQQLQNYTTQMQGDYNANTGVGNAGSMYNYFTNFGNQQAGYDPQAMQAATQNLTQEQNQLANVTNASQSSTGGYGLSGAQLAGFYGSLSAPLQQQATAQNNVVGNMLNKLNAATQIAQQGTTAGFTGEQQTSANLNQTYQNLLAQASQYKDSMLAYENMAQDQGGLNAQQQATYNSIAQGYATTAANAAQAYAAANLANQQAKGAALANTQTQNAMNQAAAKQQASLQNTSNTEYQNMMTGTQKNSTGKTAAQTTASNIMNSFTPGAQQAIKGFTAIPNAIAGAIFR